MSVYFYWRTGVISKRRRKKVDVGGWRNDDVIVWLSDPCTFACRTLLKVGGEQDVANYDRFIDILANRHFYRTLSFSSDDEGKNNVRPCV